MHYALTHFCLSGSYLTLNWVPLFQFLIAARCEVIEYLLFLAVDHGGRLFEPIGSELLGEFDVDLSVFARTEFP